MIPHLLAQNNAELDSGDKTIQCGRKADQLKLWFMWKAHGDAGFGRRVDRCIGLVEYMAQKLEVCLYVCVCMCVCVRACEGARVFLST